MINPIGNCLLVELQKHQTSASGLELSVKEEDKSLRAGKVLAVPVGGGTYKEISVGDMIIFGEYAYDTLLYEGNYYIFVDFNDVIGKIC